VVEDQGPWFVRVIENKVAVGVFACTELQLFDLIDEVVEPDACEYKKLEPGGFIFSGDLVLHDLREQEEDDVAYLDSYSMTESWSPMYEDSGLWRRMDTPFFDNDE
jgi:hypothetical protein